MSQIAVIHQQRVLNKDFAVYGSTENPYFLAKDVAEWIEHNKPAEMILNVDDDEKLKAILSHSGQRREMWFLTEDGLYEVLMQSRKPIAKQFKKQVKAILKEIRQHGAYVHASDDDDEIMVLAKGMMAAQRAIQRKDKVIEQQQEVIKAQQPKVLFADSVTASDTVILVREFAKVLKQNNIDMGEKRLFAWLRENGYLIKRVGSDYNLPTQRSMDLGLFFITQSTINRTEGTQIVRTARLTGKGQQYFINKFLKAGEIA